MVAFSYHVYMELMASDSSAELDLSIHTVSTHAYPRPSRRACLQAAITLWKPERCLCVNRVHLFDHFWKAASFVPHVCDKMAYGGMLAPEKY